MSDSRQFVPELLVTLEHLADGRGQLRAPCPGLWRDPPARGSLIRPGDELGKLEILGVLHRLRAPEGAIGIVVDDGAEHELARRPVEHGTALLTLDPEALGQAVVAEAAAAATAAGADGTLVFVAPSSGRFYRRPGPDRPLFVEAGQIIERGHTLGLLEVMKTFTRVNYDDDKLPARARVVAVVAEDQQDLGRGDPIVTLEAI